MKRIVFSAFLILVVTACAQSQNAENETVNNTEPSEQTDNGYLRKTGIDTLQTAYFASGCFWCVEGVYEAVEGVAEAESGYAGGNKVDPTYAEVC